VFGIELNLAGVTGKFIESIPAKKGESVNFRFEYNGPFFNSISYTETDSPDIVQVGAAYCIDTLKYAESLARKKVITANEVNFVRAMAAGPVVHTQILA
jgi:hypothetical protein